MGGWRQRKERFGGRARAAVTVAAVGVAVASLGAVALASSSASGREGRSWSVDQATSLAVGRDGKLLVAGMSGRQHYGDFTLARYTTSGRLDRSFGKGGKVVTSFGARDVAIANSIAIRPDGKIVAAGWANIPPKRYTEVAGARYTGAGKLDRTFARNGKLLTYFGSRGPAGASALAIQADGKLVVAGTSSGFALARYTQRGRLDRSFGRGGEVVTNFGGASSLAQAYATAIQPDGKIVVAGGATPSDRVQIKFALARYTPQGTLDRSFGNRGRVVTKVGVFDTEAVALVIQADGKLVVTGKAVAGRGVGFALVRYSADGKLDPSFGRGGITYGAGTAWALAIQRDGKLVTAGSAMGRYRKFSLARFFEDGSLDEGFGQSGRVRTDFRAGAIASAVVVQPDGKIAAAGTVAYRDVALARYTSGGKLDGSFGSGGKVRTDFGSVGAIRGR
jgi:uncharacterized delta-60 repeat protein